ncbi:carbohydrate ABC transporter permease [bacterium]|nr:carbohydrate ABC transporter permease [bacterium]
MKLNKYIFYRMSKSTATHIFLMAVAFSCLFPLFWMMRSSLMTNETVFVDKSFIPQMIHFNNYVTAWVDGGFGTYFFNSIIYTVSVVVGILIISSLAAYAFSRLEFPGKNFFFYMFIASLMIPLPGSFVPLVVLMNKLGIANTRYGYILCMIFSSGDLESLIIVLLKHRAFRLFEV